MKSDQKGFAAGRDAAEQEKQQLQPEVMRGLDSRLKYGKAIVAAQIYGDEGADIGLAEAERLGSIEYKDGRRLDDPPLLFKSAPILLEAWRLGWKEQCHCREGRSIGKPVDKEQALEQPALEMPGGDAGLTQKLEPVTMERIEQVADVLAKDREIAPKALDYGLGF